MRTKQHYNLRFSTGKVCLASIGSFGLLLMLACIITSGIFATRATPVYATSATSSVVITLNVTTGIAISSPPNSSLSTSLGIAQNTAIGTTTWTVDTNDTAGYTLALNATSSPAMQSGANNITDLAGGPSAWSVSSGAAAFGYSVYGTDTATSTWGLGTTGCQAGATSTISTTLNYKGFTTSPFTVAQRSSTTTPTGITTTVCYAVQQNNFFIPSGTYTATIVATATAL